VEVDGKPCRKKNRTKGGKQSKTNQNKKGRKIGKKPKYSGNRAVQLNCKFLVTCHPKGLFYWALLQKRPVI